MHPHFHVLLHVDKSYFKGTNYVKRDVWLNEWRKSYKDFNITQVDIRNLKQSIYSGDLRKLSYENDTSMIVNCLQSMLNEMIAFFEQDNTKKKVLVGDLNIAPNKNDVWSHNQLINVVSYTQVERDLLNDLMLKGKWTDIIRYRNNIKHKKVNTSINKNNRS